MVSVLCAGCAETSPEEGSTSPVADREQSIHKPGETQVVVPPGSGNTQSQTGEPQEKPPAEGTEEKPVETPAPVEPVTEPDTV